MEQYSLFDDDTPYIPQNLSERFGENPFSILRADTGRWISAEQGYKRLGIKGGLGRDVDLFNAGFSNRKNGDRFDAQSIFSAHLTEIIYSWFAPINGRILDPFAGGSVRGIVAGIMGNTYTGIDIRKEQVEEDEKQVEELSRHLKTKPEYICGDSREVLDDIVKQFDLVFSCPPYADLEVYSDLQGDISNMTYNDFLTAYTDIIQKSCAKLKDGGFAVFVVSEIRDNKGFYRGFVPSTIQAFQKAGMNYYNDMILMNVVGTACRRTRQFDMTRKVVKMHQNVLVFCKGKPALNGFRVY